MNTAMTVPKRLFSIDLRSLAAFRMALGVLLLADLVMRAQDLSAHYTDWGVLPRDILSAHFWPPCVSRFILSPALPLAKRLFSSWPASLRLRYWSASAHL